MHIQDYLKNHSLEELKESYGIKIREYDDRYVFNYDQIASADYRFEPVVVECRNLILSKDFRVLHRSFDRFFNYGEDPETNQLDISRVSTDEKLDGSLIGFYHDGQKWNFCTRKRAFAEANMMDNVTPFIDLIKSVAGVENLYKFCQKENSYIFELIAPQNRIITPYDETKLVLLAVRNKETGEFQNREKEARNIHWSDLPRTYTFQSFEEIIQAAGDLPPLTEGYVCRTENYKFIKVKNPAYVALAALRGNGGISQSNILKLVRGCNESEYLAYFPEEMAIFTDYLVIRDHMEQYFLNLCDKYKDIESQKDFALAIKEAPFNGILFSLRKGVAFKDIPFNEPTVVKLYNYFLQNMALLPIIR